MNNRPQKALFFWSCLGDINKSFATTVFVKNVNNERRQPRNQGSEDLYLFTTVSLSGNENLSHGWKDYVSLSGNLNDRFFSKGGYTVPEESGREELGKLMQAIVNSGVEKNMLSVRLHFYEDDCLKFFTQELALYRTTALKRIEKKLGEIRSNLNNRYSAVEIKKKVCYLLKLKTVLSSLHSGKIHKAA